MSVTIKDVANEAGVSISTVSKIINGKGSISQDTINRVQETIRKLNYTPNSRAVSFAKQNTKNIIFLTLMKKNEPYLNPHMFEIMDGSYSALSDLDYTLSLMDISMKDG
ncbi:MAG: LacI family DNA-binding transcriptional regulator, partial [Pseudobutyrivibrio sp.]|nr:LacI family DNA-binding transcriptional regulator [Pseudobutyrivibrio sp.]